MAKDTREEILEAALNMFSTNNYHATSMSMIAEETGVSKGTLYWHFDSKEDLFRELVLAGLDYFNENYQRIESENLNAVEKIYQIIEFSIKMLAENSKMGQILQNNIQLISSEFQKKMIERHKSAIDMIKKIIEQGIEEEKIKSKNTHNTAVMILTLIFNTQSEELYYSSDTVKEDVDFIYDFIMQGISKEV